MREGCGMVNLEAAKREILEWVSKAVNISVEELDLDRPLADMGMDSLDAVHMVASIEAILQTELPEDVIQRVRCLNDVFRMMEQTAAAA